MINYFYNIILKTDICDLYSDVLTSIRKDFYISKEKQKGKITQNSSGNSLFYEFSLEKDRVMKWNVTNEESIFSDTKNLADGQYCISYYGENGLYKVLTFSKFHTLLKVEYFNVTKTTVPYCVIEPRKANNDLCIMLSSRSENVPSVLFAMPDVDDEYILDKVESDFDDYTIIASTNEGVVKFLSETQLETFKEFVADAERKKADDTAPESFIDDKDAVLARKLNPKDFNIKRNLSEIIDISQAQEFSYDNIEEELVSDIEFEVDDENVDQICEPVEINVEDEIDSATEDTTTTEMFDNDEGSTEVPAQENDNPVVDEVVEEEVSAYDEVVVEVVSEIGEVVAADEIANVDSIVSDDTDDVVEDTNEVSYDDIRDLSGQDVGIAEEVEEHNASEDVSDITVPEITAEPGLNEIYVQGKVQGKVEEIDSHDNFVVSEFCEPDSVIDGKNAKYLYYGSLNSENKRDGFGRTASENGRTAYEGDYADNKRNGVGAYYYKDSGLCYYGQWKDNKREGVGVGVSSLDKSIHVGKFSANKPCGDGVRVEENGDIRFVKKVLSNGITVEFKFENDKVIVVKYNENGDIISENTSNLMYF